MQPKSILALAAFVGCCYAQAKSATDAVTAIDGITKDITELKVLLDDTTNEQVFDNEEALVSKYRDIIKAEAAAFPRDDSVKEYSEAGQGEVCDSLKEANKQHVLLLDSLASRYIIFRIAFRDISSLLKDDDDYSDLLAYEILDRAPTCDRATSGADDLAEKFIQVREKYDSDLR